MMNLKLKSCCALLLLALDGQSLVDIARQEAARRKQLEQQGIEAKVIVGNGPHLPPDSGNVTTSTGSGMEIERPSAKEPDKRPDASLRRYQTTLKKLDREIQQTELRLASLRTRLQAEKWEALKTGRSSGRSGSRKAKGQLETAIEKLQEKLQMLRNERFEVYESGKKAGHMPGELDGKGLIP
jgi:uncharacterized protein YciI